MNTLMFVLGTCIVFGIVAHAFIIVMKETKFIYTMDITTVKEEMFDSETTVSISTIKKRLLHQRIINTIGIILGIVTIFIIVNSVTNVIMNLLIIT